MVEALGTQFLREEGESNIQWTGVKVLTALQRSGHPTVMDSLTPVPTTSLQEKLLWEYLPSLS
jgi:hypothetical protein